MKTTENVVGKEKWMPCPTIQCEYPGLAYFWPLDQLIVAAKSDPLHDVIGQKGTNFMIYNKDREKVFIALQKSTCTKYYLKVFNFYGNEVVRVKRKVYDKASIWAPESNFVGTVDQGCFLKNSFTIKNSDGNVVLTVRSKERCPLVFTIQSEDQEIGEIRKKWLEMGSVDNFGLSFPLALDVKVKAVMLGACFLVAYLKY